MHKIFKTIITIVVLSSLSTACKKTDSDSTSESDRLAQVTALENKLDSLNSHPPGITAPGSSANGLTAAQQNEYATYFKAGMDAIKVIRNLAKLFKNYFGHKWTVISYSDGFCIFNRVRNYRTIDDIINTAMGKGGDCDWWPFPEGSAHVCLRNKSDAKKMVDRHGKIIRIRFIDHPTARCGK